MSEAAGSRLRADRRRWLGLVLLGVCSAAWPEAESEMDELHVKAAFLYKFTGYVDWPESAFGNADAPFVMGVLGSDALLAELSQVTAGRRIHERPIVVRRVQAAEAMASLHLLFVGRSETLRAEVSRPVLIVSEAEGGMPHGSMINFLVVDRHVRFEIALPNVEKAGLRMSSRLLAVAQKVYQGTER